MRFSILTLFPEMLTGMLSGSILGRAAKAGLIETRLINIRDFSDRKHRNADDYPFGGGAGMVMLAQPIMDAMAFATREAPAHRVLLSPRGKTFTQADAQRLAGMPHLALLCGHYEGVDQRAVELCVDEEISIGDYVLTGGELPALVVVDAVARLIPGVLGSEDSAREESFSDGLLEFPQYTRPQDFRGLPVPQVLLGGNHAAIEQWRLEQRLRVTHARRPDLLAAWQGRAALSRRRQRLVDQLLRELDAQREAEEKEGGK